MPPHSEPSKSGFTARYVGSDGCLLRGKGEKKAIYSFFKAATTDGKAKENESEIYPGRADLLVWLLSQLEQIPIYPNAHKFKVIKKKK